jgi:hypothetical protein
MFYLHICAFIPMNSNMMYTKLPVINPVRRTEGQNVYVLNLKFGLVRNIINVDTTNPTIAFAIPARIIFDAKFIY